MQDSQRPAEIGFREAQDVFVISLHGNQHIHALLGKPQRRSLPPQSIRSLLRRGDLSDFAILWPAKTDQESRRI